MTDMATTTTRIRPATLAGFKAIAEGDGRSMLDVLDEAEALLRRRRRIARARRQLDDLRRDPEAWASYVAELDGFPTSDGLG